MLLLCPHTRRKAHVADDRIAATSGLASDGGSRLPPISSYYDESERRRRWPIRWRYDRGLPGLCRAVARPPVGPGASSLPVPARPPGRPRVGVGPVCAFVRIRLDRRAVAITRTSGTAHPISLIVPAEPLEVLDGNSVPLIEPCPARAPGVYPMGSHISASWRATLSARPSEPARLSCPARTPVLSCEDGPVQGPSGHPTLLHLVRGRHQASLSAVTDLGVDKPA
jgi:hypothetical protein